MLNSRLVVKETKTGELYYETDRSGEDLLKVGLLNKGTAFTQEERREFRLNGLLPYAIEDLQTQVDRAYREYSEYPTDLAKNIFANTLHDTNEVVFYKMLLDHITEMMPVIYTPTEGLSIEQYSHEYREPRGIYISYPEIDQIDELLDERLNQDVDLILVTDSEEILGIGDQGVGGMGISVAKLVVYTLCAGINPARTLPVVLDVGTNRESLLEDPLYLGWRHPRVRGEDYDRFIDKFVTAITQKFPNALLHWEDFGRDNARRILEKYRAQICTFNDDVQGTGAIASAGLIAASKSIGVPLKEHRIVIFGSGTAGCGIADQFASWMIKDGLSLEQARQQIWCVDKQGLLLANMTDLTDAQKPYARAPKEAESWLRDESGKIALEEVVKQVHPTVLLGTSTRTGAFIETVVREMSAHVERPIIFPLSNPTKLCEAKPVDVFNWTDGRAMVATGSPFPIFVYNGKEIRIGECNNSYVFPGLGLGTIVAKAKHISDDMIDAGVEEMAKLCPVYSDSSAPLMPVLEQVREVSRAVAIAVAKQAIQEGLAEPMADVEKAVEQAMWEPKYIPIRPKS